MRGSDYYYLSESQHRVVSHTGGWCQLVKPPELRERERERERERDWSLLLSFLVCGGKRGGGGGGHGGAIITSLY